MPTRSKIRSYPWTAECLVVSVVLFFVCSVRASQGVQFADAQREWGAVVGLRFVGPDDSEASRVLLPTGPFDLWNGEWWRIPVNSFHHANWLHLLVNCLSLWLLGCRLEYRWGSWRFAFFLIPGVYLPILCEFAMGQLAVGLSGAICAVFGALIVLRALEQDNSLSEFDVQTGLGFLVFCVWLTAADVIQIANVAHFVGLIYGACAAWVMSGSFRFRRLFKTFFLLGHLALIPFTMETVHPVNNGNYLWYRAVEEPDPATRMNYLNRAVKVNPNLVGAWLKIAKVQLAEPNVRSAWSTLISGLSWNRSDRDMIESTRRLWRRLLPDVERKFAIEEIRRVFGVDSNAWLELIRYSPTISIGSEPDSQTDESALSEGETRQWALDQKIDLREPVFEREPNPGQLFNPDEPGSAAEGASL